MDTAKIRAHLVELQTELKNRIYRIESEKHESNAPDNDQWSDQGGLHGRDDEQFAIQMASKAELNQIAEALARLDDGHYGLCEVCGNEIEAGRLAVLPYAVRCVAHAG